MAAFINNDITTAGLIVLAKGVAGQKINYTKIVLGDGYLEEGQTPRTLTGVVSPKATVDITKLKINGDGTVAVGGIFTNGDETDGFYYRELGLYAEDPDPEVGEVLYCYGNCGDLAEWIPPSGGATIVEKTIDIVTAIGTATNVTAYIPADAYATKEDYETYKAIALGAQATAEEALALARQAIAIAQDAEASEHQQDRNAVGRRFQRHHKQPVPDHIRRLNRHHAEVWRLERFTSKARVLMGNCYNYTPIPPAEASCIIAHLFVELALPCSCCKREDGAIVIQGKTYDGSSARVTIKGEEVRYYGKQRTLAAIRAGQCRPPALRP